MNANMEKDFGQMKNINRVSIHGGLDARGVESSGGRRTKTAQEQMVEGGEGSRKLWSKYESITPSVSTLRCT